MKKILTLYPKQPTQLDKIIWGLGTHRKAASVLFCFFPLHFERFLRLILPKL